MTWRALLLLLTVHLRADGTAEACRFRCGAASAELDGARILVWRDLLLHEVLQFLDHLGSTLVSRAQDDERLDNLPAFFVLDSDDAAFSDRRMQQQRAFDLRAGDVVATRNDHVVDTATGIRTTVFVDEIRVAGQIPATLHILPLPVVCEITAAGRPLTARRPDLARWKRPQFLIDHARDIAGDRFAGRAGLTSSPGAK